MKSDKPLILISNDDGVHAKGIRCLTEMLSGMGELVVVAPDSPRSGAACAVTSATVVGYREVSRRDGLAVYACTGTPADCVKLALQELVPRRPDLVVGGINHGDNAAVNVHYSGTMGVVLEGCMKGLPSVGFSLCDHRPQADFAPLEKYVRGLAREVLQRGLPEGVCLNVNFPLAASFKGVRVCRQARGRWVSEWETAANPHGKPYFWLTGRFESQEDDGAILSADRRGERVLWPDALALREGYVAVTPTRIDVTSYEQAEAMQAWPMSF